MRSDQRSFIGRMLVGEAKQYSTYCYVTRSSMEAALIPSLYEIVQSSKIWLESPSFFLEAASWATLICISSANAVFLNGIIF